MGTTSSSTDYDWLVSNQTHYGRKSVNNQYSALQWDFLALKD